MYSFFSLVKVPFASDFSPNFLKQLYSVSDSLSELVVRGNYSNFRVFSWKIIGWESNNFVLYQIISYYSNKLFYTIL